MAHMEQTHFRHSEFYPKDFYGRYVDDIFCLFRDLNDVEKFHEFINSIHPSTKFEVEHESGDQLTFLDTIVRRSATSSPVISTHVKSSDRGLIYDITSFIPNKYKINLVSTLFYRCYKIASSWSVFNVDAKLLTQRLLNNGFTRSMVNTCINNVICKFHYKLSPPKDPTVPKNKIIVSLPYLGHLSYLLKRNITRLLSKFYPSCDIQIVFRRGFKIGNLFSHKDKLPKSCR